MGASPAFVSKRIHLLEGTLKVRRLEAPGPRGRGNRVRVLPQFRQDAPVSAVYPIRLTESAKVRVCVEHLQACLGAESPG
jgi:LysR family transcriptional activator of dmlA